MSALEEQDSITKPVGFAIGQEPAFNMNGPAARKVQWLMELRAFCSEASVVGLRYVANRSAYYKTAGTDDVEQSGLRGKRRPSPKKDGWTNFGDG